MLYLYTYSITLVVMGMIDAVWLYVMTSRFYKPYLGHLLSPAPNLTAAVLFYVLYAMGLTGLVIVPGIESHTSLLKVGVMGALFGLVAYGTYDLTNLATLKSWPCVVSLVDMVWGSGVSAVVCVISVWLYRLIHV